MKKLAIIIILLAAFAAQAEVFRAGGRIYYLDNGIKVDSSTLVRYIRFSLPDTGAVKNLSTEYLEKIFTSPRESPDNPVVCSIKDEFPRNGILCKNKTFAALDSKTGEIIFFNQRSNYIFFTIIIWLLLVAASIFYGVLVSLIDKKKIIFYFAVWVFLLCVSSIFLSAMFCWLLIPLIVGILCGGRVKKIGRIKQMMRQIKLCQEDREFLEGLSAYWCQKVIEIGQSYVFHYRAHKEFRVVKEILLAVLLKLNEHFILKGRVSTAEVSQLESWHKALTADNSLDISGYKTSHSKGQKLVGYYQVVAKGLSDLKK